MCFITFCEHFSLKKKKQQQNKAKQKYSSGELRKDQNSFLHFSVDGRTERGQAGTSLSQGLSWSSVS